MSDDVTYGVEAGEEQMTAGSRWPWIRPKDGDRLRFHFLTTGADPLLVATKFHSIGTGKNSRNIVCVSALTRGNEDCVLCDQDGGQNRRNLWGCWVLVDYILHPNDNPDEEGDSWPHKQLKILGADGEEKTRSVFQEVLETALTDESVVPGQVRFLQLPAGRQKVWWSQVSNAWMQTGDLRKHLYELHRVGAGRDDTNYTLTAKEENPLDEALLEREDIKDLPTVDEVFRSSLSQLPKGDAVLGGDELDGGGGDSLPKAETEPEEKTPAPAASTSNDLI